MTTLLVTTDFSTNSKAGIRFALQLASQTPCKLIFYHVSELLTPTMWSKKEVDEFVENKMKIERDNLGKFIQTMLNKYPTPYSPFEYVVEMAANVDDSIVQYAKKVQADYICMSTHGAGMFKKIIGTNASTLVDTSPIPVFVVPQNYHSKTITKIGYPTDLNDIDKELPIVQTLAALFAAKADVFHFYYQLHKDFDQKTYDDLKTQYPSESVSFHDPKICIEYSLVENIQRAMAKERASLLVMFTHQKEKWFERFFFESKTSEMTFDLKLPLLAFKKQTK